MKYGIYYAYWAKQWGVDYVPYVERVAKCGYDIMEISCAGLKDVPDHELRRLKDAADAHGLMLTGGYGPKACENIASADPAVVENALAFWNGTFKALQKLGIASVVGGLYGYWPVDYTKPFDKQADLERSILNMRRMADMAADYGITTLGMEVLNRHEGYLLNTAKECVAYVDAVDKPNVKVHLDTYHMLLEEDSFTEAIHTAGKRLGHLHVGENNRRLPGQGCIIDWAEIARALHDVGFDGNVVAEPFVIDGGEVGRDIRLWRPLLTDVSDERLDSDAKASVEFMHKMFD